MRKDFLISAVVLHFFLLVFNDTVAQQTIDSLKASEEIIQELVPPNYMSEDFVSSLPTLQNLIDSAEIHSPLLAFSADEIAVREREVKSERRRILENIGLESSFKYGMFDNFFVSENPAEALNDSYLSTSEQFRYSFGVTLRVPLFSLVDRRNQIHIAELKAQQGQKEMEKTKQEIRKVVISEYNNLMAQHRILLLRNQEMISSEIQVLMGENQFKNGEISIEQLTRFKSTFLKAQIDLETARKDLITTYLILQDIAGFQF